MGYRSFHNAEFTVRRPFLIFIESGFPLSSSDSGCYTFVSSNKKNKTIMKLSKRITRRGTNAALLATVILICALLNTAIAQSTYNYHDTHHPAKQVKTA